MNSLRSSLLLSVLVVGLAGCGNDAPVTPVTPVKAPVAKVRPAVAKPETVETSIPVFVYDAEGLRDPFVPFLKLETKKAKTKKLQVFVPQTPLQRYAVEELQLVGVLWANGGRSKALIEDPEGKGYVVTAGTLVGDRGGKIVGVRPDRVVIQERVVDILGEEQVNEVTMALHMPEDEVRP